MATRTSVDSVVEQEGSQSFFLLLKQRFFFLQFFLKWLFLEWLFF